MKAYPAIQTFGLETLLTDQDDPELWEAALQANWPLPADPACLVDALRFDLGRRLVEGETPQGEKNELHAKMRGMVDIEEWCFERIDETHLKVKPCPETTPPPAFLGMGMGLSMMMTIGQQTPPPMPVQVVFVYLGITRPSRGAAQAVVYSGSTAPGVGDGKALIWQRKEGRGWEPTDQRVAWWIT